MSEPKENIFISRNVAPNKSRYGQTSYTFNGEKYFYLDDKDESNALQRNFMSLLNKDIVNYTIKLCMFKLVDECKEPFLQFLLDKKDDTMTFPGFELSTSEFVGAEDINTTFQEKCCEWFQKTIKETPMSQQNGIAYMQCYRGFLEEPENTIYVLFDCTYVSVDVSAQRFWGILDEIVNEKHIFSTPMDKQIYNMIQNNEFIAYIKDKNGERINMPCCLYLCKVNEKGEYDNAYYEIDEHNMKQKSATDGKITHDTFGHFYYFTTDPIHKDSGTHRLKRFSVFIDNALYVLNINKPIEDIDFVTDDEDDFDDTHKSYKDYTCIYFFEDGLQLWCVKSLSRFVEL
jgi:hypothetical protein